jgi:hypothetical protein
MKVMARLTENCMSVEQKRPVPPDEDLEKVIRAMEKRGVKRLLEQGKSREDAVRLTGEAMDAPLPQKVPSFDAL